MALRNREVHRASRSRLADVAGLAEHLRSRPPAARGNSVGDKVPDPFVVTYWPFARTNRFQALLYSQSWRYGAAALPVASFEDVVEIPWPGLLICHFHWLAAVNSQKAIDSFRVVLGRLKDQRRPIVWTVHNVLPHDPVDIEAGRF